jgi:hypothetical protein
MEIVLQNSDEIKENKQNTGQFSGTAVSLNEDQDCNWKESFIILKCMLFVLHQLGDLPHAQEPLTS